MHLALLLSSTVSLLLLMSWTPPFKPTRTHFFSEAAAANLHSLIKRKKKRLQSAKKKIGLVLNEKKLLLVAPFSSARAFSSYLSVNNHNHTHTLISHSVLE